MMRCARAFRILMLGVLLACTGGAGREGGAGGSRRDADFRALESAAVRDSVAAAAIRIASSRDPAALERLGRFLVSPAFLARLDDTGAAQLAYSNLGQVFAALAKIPSPATESLCLQVLAAGTFKGNADRVFFALPALAAVRPMSAAGAAVFSATNVEGFFGVNGPLLAANGSPRAMAILTGMFRDSSHRVADRIDMAREGLVPYRTALPTLRLVDSLTRRPDLDPELAIALAECVFDYRPEAWYGKRRNPPAAPPWAKAPAPSRREAARLGERLLGAHPDWPENLRRAIQALVVRR
jgi:hypothetical protein